MRRKGLWLSVLATAVMAGSASAATIEGSLANGLNWGTYDDNNSEQFKHGSVNLTPNSGYRWIPGISDSITDAANDSWTPVSPAGGGQNYDAEAAFYFFDASTNALHLGIMTGFNPYGEIGDFGSNFYRSGDLFIDLGGNGDYDLAIGTALGGAGTNTEGGSRAGTAWYNNDILTPWIIQNDLNHTVPESLEPVVHDGIAAPGNTTTNFSVANPYRVRTAHEDVSVLASVEYSYDRVWYNDTTNQVTAPHLAGQNNYAQERWFYEYRLVLEGTALDTLIETLTTLGGGIGLHWTMGCGNDYLSVTDSNRPFPPVVPVPAAAPMVLLGMGAIGLARRFRRNKQN